MFGGMKYYAVYAKRSDGNAMEDVILVKEGFNIFAFLFTAFWALYHRSYKWFFVLFALIMLVSYLSVVKGIIALGTAWAIRIGIQVFTGFEASEIVAAGLKKRGYVLYSLACGRNEDEARLRFLDGETTSVISTKSAISLYNS